MLQALQAKNPCLTVSSVNDSAFADYGRVIYGLNIDGIMAAAKDIPLPEEGSRYVLSEPSFEKLPLAETMRKELFGGIETQVGYCYGHNQCLNATEWHTCSEINIAITPLVLLLGKRSEIQEGFLDSSRFKAFYVPEGTVIEVYATTLHFCPCEVLSSGFGCVVGLPKDTNKPMDFEKNDPLLYKYNKWVIAHPENVGMIKNGAAVGITGENIQLNY